MKYPQLLHSGINNKIVALSETEVAKLFTRETRTEIGSQAEKMKFANNVNGLVSKFVRLDFDESLQAEMLVMEYIDAIDYTTYEVAQCELWWEVFEGQMKQLHEAGFVHRCVTYENILLTTDGLRLIDVSISALRSQVGDKLFEKYIETELSEMMEFREYFLNR